MNEDYKNFSITELRNMLLDGELRHESLNEEDYSDLIDNEMSLSNPLNEVIDFCLTGLDKYSEYRELENINIDIRALIKQSTSNNKKENGRNIIFIMRIAAAVIGAMILTQTVAMALGHNLIGYIFKWGYETLQIESPSSDTTDNKPVFNAYDNFDDLPEEMVSYIPVYIWDNFLFHGATQLERKEAFSLSFRFNGKPFENTNMQIDIGKNRDSSIEKDDEYFEKYDKNGIIYNVFKNIDYFKIVWIENDLIYHINVNLPIEEVKNIVNYFH